MELSRRSVLKQVLSKSSWRRLNIFVPETVKLLFRGKSIGLEGSAEEAGLRLGQGRKERFLELMSSRRSVSEHHDSCLGSGLTESSSREASRRMSHLNLDMKRKESEKC